MYLAQSDHASLKSSFAPWRNQGRGKQGACDQGRRSEPAILRASFEQIAGFRQLESGFTGF